MIKLIIFITIIGLITLYIVDKNIFKDVIKSFNKPKTRLYSDKEIKDNGYLAIAETIHETPMGCIFLPFLIIIIGIIILFINQFN